MFNRENIASDPHASLKDYDDCINDGACILYTGEKNDGIAVVGALKHGGADVYIRNTKKTTNSQLDLSGWVHVRHVPGNNNQWYKAVDHLAGTEVYGDKSDSSKEWSIAFDDKSFN